jgi:uncharacterized protein YciU (UPF0263 family)
MKKLFIILLIFIPLVLSAEGWKSENIDGYSFNWRFVEDYLEVELSYPAKGWISVGFDAENKMSGANIIIGAVDGNDVVIEDHYGNRTLRHSTDERLGGNSDVRNAEGFEKDGVTTLKFTIPADSGDEFDKPLSEGGTYRVIFASSKSDNIGRKHRNRTGADVTL